MNILAIDLGGSAIKYAYFKDGEIVDQGRVNNDNIDTFENYEKDIEKIILKYDDIDRIGFSVPGGYKDGQINGASALMCIHGFNIKAFFENKYKVPVSFVNDGNAACLGEMYYGAAKGYKNVISFVLGTGIGNGIVLNGKLVVGKHGFGGEAADTLVNFNFNTNVFESYHNYASVGGVIYRYCNQKGIPVDYTMGKEVFDAADKGDEVAVKIVEEFYQYLALLISSVNYMSDAEVITVSGPVVSRDDFMNRLQKYITIIESASGNGIEFNIKTSSIAGLANLYGAYYYCVNENELMS